MFLLGCAPSPAQLTSSSSPPDQYSCLLPSEQRMLVAELFFGRGIKGREPLTDTEWAEFTAQIITPNFPDGSPLSRAKANGAIRRPGGSPATGPRSC